MKQFSNVNTVLFDLGDTLLYFDGDGAQVMEEAHRELFSSLREAGLDISQEFMDDFYDRMQAYYQERETEFIEHTVTYILRGVLEAHGLPPLTPAQVERALADMHRISQAHWLPEEDALPTLQRLQEMGYNLGLISNGADDPNTQLLIDKGGFRPYFKVIISSATAGVRKPNPSIFYSALDALKIAPNQAVMVGDTLGADILGAHNAGMLAIWITRRADKPANRAHADTIHPDATIFSLAELPQVLAGQALGGGG